MKLRTILFFSATIPFTALGLTVQTFAQRSENQIITFDINSFFTSAKSINSAGEITGVYAKFFRPNDGFLRDADGTITLFDCPGALGSTSPSSINAAGDITGSCSDAAGTHGFVRMRNGGITTFDASGSPVPLGAGGTSPSSINAAGKITGSYINVTLDSVQHGFLRDSDGTITSFDCRGVPIGTSPSSINGAGEVTGNCSDAAGMHGFLRTADGNIITFDASDAGSPASTSPQGINTKGEITGSYTDPNGHNHGFLRAADGMITLFDCSGTLIGTFPTAIDSAGEITGNCSGAHGFLRARDGTITTFDAPGALTGTFPTAINSAGEITGFFFIDPEAFPRSFLRYADHGGGSETQSDAVIP